MIMHRMEKVMIRIQHSISGLSDAERSLSTELQTRQTEIDQLKSLLDQVTSNCYIYIYTKPCDINMICVIHTYTM